jgi:D-alanine-D-alanine ligase
VRGTFRTIGSWGLIFFLDKQGVLKIAESIGIPVPRSIYVDEGDAHDPAALGLAYPIIVKPNSTDGSFGITSKSVCHTLQDVHAAVDQIRNIFHIHGAILLQEYLTGRDVNVGVMERWNPQGGRMEPWVLPITEEDYSALPEDLPKICGFESKVSPSFLFCFSIVLRIRTCR